MGRNEEKKEKRIKEIENKMKRSFNPTIRNSSVGTDHRRSQLI